jgi:hypothetical protein
MSASLDMVEHRGGLGSSSVNGRLEADVWRAGGGPFGLIPLLLPHSGQCYGA